MTVNTYIDHTLLKPDATAWTDWKVDFGFSGIASNENGTWYIENGKVNFTYSGTYEDENGRIYDIKSGNVAWRKFCVEPDLSLAKLSASSKVYFFPRPAT